MFSALSVHTTTHNDKVKTYFEKVCKCIKKLESLLYKIIHILFALLFLQAYTCLYKIPQLTLHLIPKTKPFLRFSKVPRSTVASRIVK